MCNEGKRMAKYCAYLALFMGHSTSYCCQNNATTVKFVVKIFCWGIIFSYLNTSILKLWDSMLHAQCPLTAGDVR